MGGLSAIAAILRAASGFYREQETALNVVRRLELPVGRMSYKQ
jgi:hypothetical protein